MFSTESLDFWELDDDIRDIAMVEDNNKNSPGKCILDISKTPIKLIYVNDSSFVQQPLQLQCAFAKIIICPDESRVYFEYIGGNKTSTVVEFLADNVIVKKEKSTIRIFT